MKLLVADDDPTIRDLVGHYLTENNYTVDYAANGQEALLKAAQTDVGLLILDIDMPDLDGYQVCQQLRGNFQTRHLPILMLTGKSEVAQKVSGLRLGADDYMTKPFHAEELKARIDGLLCRHKQMIGANPLTQLPGGPAIEDEFMRRQASGKPFGFAYIDIDHFKAFNDLYGYDQGDGIIKDTALAMLDVLKRQERRDFFLGHIGGDDFVLFAAADAVGSVAREIAAAFDKTAPLRYGPQHRESGFIETANRLGVIERFPLMTLKIAVITTDKNPVEHYGELVNMASELKAYAKSLKDRKDSIVITERRRSATV
ncbi:MAG: response regulator [Elusimicrobiota bacterium]